MKFIDRSDLVVTSRGPHHVVGTAGTATSLIRRDELCGFFAGVNTVLDYLTTEMPHPEKEKSSSQKADAGFNSFATYDDALTTYRHHPTKVRGFTETDLALSNEDAAGISVVHDITGDFLDIGRYLEGEPEAFGVMTDGNPRARRVNLLLNIDAVCYMEADTLNARGQRLQRLVDWLEARQIRTAITAVSSTGCAHLEIQVKRHDETLDLNDIAVVGHGDFLRRAVLRFMEYSPTWGYGYGSSRSLNDFLCSGRAQPGDDQEVTVVVSNQIGGVKQVNSEFDQVEARLVEVLGSTWIDDDRVISMFVNESGRIRARLGS